MHKVKQAFTDKNTGESYKPGDTYTGTDERVAELQDSGHLNVTPVADKPAAEPDKKK